MKSLGKYLAILFIFVLVFSAFPAQRASADAGVVDNPNGGFVTGGGWLNAADVQNGPINITGDTASIAYGGYTGYLYRDLDAVCDPNNTPVTFTGSLDVSGLKDNGADLFGLVDKKWIDDGKTGFQTGAYLYVGRRGDNLIIGPSDGNAGGELIQVFTTFKDFFASGSPFLLDVSAEIFNGQIKVNVAGNDYVDNYGAVTATGDWAEFAYGAYIGIDSWPSDNSVLFDLTYEGCNISTTGEATFGFVSKYKKGAEVPTGNTEFVFKAANLNFHSSGYDWLVVDPGASSAQFKGTGTLNGADGYQFMIWVTDGSPDTFRIQIWNAADGTVVYDNGMDQAIGGGSIVFHSK